MSSKSTFTRLLKRKLVPDNLNVSGFLGEVDFGSPVTKRQKTGERTERSRIDESSIGKINESDHCEKCGEFTEMDMIYLESFAVKVCRECKWSEHFECVTKTTAKSEYLLTESEMSALPFLRKELKPTEERRYHCHMKLYLKRSVEKLAKGKWLAQLRKGKVKVDHSFLKAISALESDSAFVESSNAPLSDGSPLETITEKKATVETDTAHVSDCKSDESSSTDKRVADESAIETSTAEISGDVNLEATSESKTEESVEIDGAKVHWKQAIALEKRRRSKVRVEKRAKLEEGTHKSMKFRSVIAEIKPSAKVVAMVGGNSHEHTFGDAAFDSETEEWSKTCADCGFVEMWQQLF